MNVTQLWCNGSAVAKFSFGSFRKCWTLLAAVLLLCGTANAQVGRYFLTDESSLDRVWEFNGGSLVSSFFVNPTTLRHGPIVVDGAAQEIRTTFSTNVGAGPVPGSSYDLSGSLQGPLSLDMSGLLGGGRVIDAGFDGQNTYVVSGFTTTPKVFSFNADFSGPGTFLFDLTGLGPNNPQGITYDTSTDTIWTSDYDFNAASTGGRVRQWSLAGVELFSFPVIDALGTPSERNTALAYDASDDTFWLNAHVENTLGFGLGELWQFDRNGNFLQKIHGAQSGGPNGILYWGGEILPVPEPSTAVLLCVATASIALLGRSRVLRS